MSVKTSRWILAALAAFSLVFATMAIARYQTFHNETFDLAFYSRMAWGVIRGDGWDPIVGANVLGLHLSPVLIPFGLLGFIADIPTLLLFSQALALCLAAYPLSKMAFTRFGQYGAILTALAFVMHPNIGHVASFEFHPGSLAILPLAWLVYAIHSESPKMFLLSVIGVLLCREDFGLVIVFTLPLLWRSSLKSTALKAAIFSFIYVAIFALILLPTFGPAEGSVDAHFGKWGGSLSTALVTWITSPFEVATHLLESKRLVMWLFLLGPFAMFVVPKPRLLVPTTPILAIALLSDFPTTVDHDSHYLTAAIPFVAGAAIESANAMKTRMPTFPIPLAFAAASIAFHIFHGATPLSLTYTQTPFICDDRCRDAQKTLETIPNNASVQAPDSLLAHLIERKFVMRAPPPDMNADFVIFDAWHRREFQGRGDLLRTKEEPLLRSWLSRDDHQLAAHYGDFWVLQDQQKPRNGFGKRWISSATPMYRHDAKLTECLRVIGSTKEASSISLFFRVEGKCDADLALRIGFQEKPKRIDLLFNGELSPAHLKRGDVVESRHDILGLREYLWVGLVRESEARPMPTDPDSLRLVFSN